MKSLYHSILNGEADISKQTDDDIIANIIKDFCVHKGGLSARAEGDRWDYNKSTHTIILRPRLMQLIDREYIVPVIDNTNGRGPELTWSHWCTEAPCVSKSDLISNGLYAMGLTVNDIHIKFEGEGEYIGTIRFDGIPDTKKKCKDIDDFAKDITSLCFLIDSQQDMWNFDCSNLGNLKYIMPKVFIENIICPCIDIKAKCTGIPAGNIISYHIDKKSKGFMYGDKPFFSRDNDRVMVNPEINEQELLDDIIKFSKNNPDVVTIHTIRAGKKVNLNIQESVKKKEITFDVK